MNLLKKLPQYFIEGLVIILSILGAFTLDRLYENYREEQRIDQLFDDLKKDLLYDFNEINSRISFNMNEYDLLDQFLTQNQITDTLHFARKVYNLPFSAILLTDRSYNELLKYNHEIPPQYDSLLTTLNGLHGRYTIRMEHDAAFHLKLRYSNYEYLRNKSWPAILNTQGVLTDEGLDEISHDVVIKNHLIMSRNELEILFKNQMVARELMVKSLMMIDQLLPINSEDSELSKDHNYIGLYKNHDRQDRLFFWNDFLVELSLNDESMSLYKEYKENQFIKSITSDTLYFDLDNNGQVSGYYYNDDRTDYHRKL